jgi:hypothetical protein
MQGFFTPGGRIETETPMLLDLGKSLSFLASLLSLYPLLYSALLEPGMHVPDRILLSLNRAALSAACCFLSGYLFLRANPEAYPSNRYGSGQPIFSTLPVRIYFYALGAMVLLFSGSWFLQTYYVPLLWKNQPYHF